MARVEISEAVFFNPGAGAALVAAVGASVQVNARDGAAATVYQAATGAATFSNPLTSDSSGRIEGWLDEGSYDLVVSGPGFSTYTQRFEAVNGKRWDDITMSPTNAAELTEAFAALADYGPAIDGLVTINLPAATLTGKFTMPDGLWFRQRAIIKGPTAGHPNVPTAIINAAGEGHGLIVGTGAFVVVRDIKVINASTGDSSTAAGFLAKEGANVWWDNCHYGGNGALAGIYNDTCTVVRVSGGAASGTQQYGRVFYNTTFTDGYGAAAVADGPDITSGTCTVAGVLAQGSYGDCFYVDTDAVPIAYLVTTSGRIRAANCELTNCTTAAVKAQETSQVNLLDGSNTLTGNTKDLLLTGFATETSLHATLDSTAEARVKLDTSSASLTGTLTATAIKSGLFTVPTWLVGKRIRVKAYGTFTGTAGTKAVGIRVLSTDYGTITFPATANGSWIVEGEIFMPTISTQLSFVRGVESVTPTSDCDRQSRSVTFDGSQSLRVYGQLGNTGDTITVEAVEVFVA